LETKTFFLSFGVCWKASKASNDVNYDELTKRQTVLTIKLCVHDDGAFDWRYTMPTRTCSSDNLTLTLI